MTNRAEVDQMVKQSWSDLPIDILVNNAGASSPLKPFVEMTKADWDLDINVNLYGQMNVAQAFFPYVVVDAAEL